MIWFLLLFLHILGACIWIGGHLFLTLRILPEALKNKEVETILNFENKYETIGIPALLTQVATGLMLSLHHGIGPKLWFTFSHPVERIVSTKLCLLIVTLTLAIHARFFIITRLKPENLPFLAWHIFMVTSLSILFLFLGILIRFGG